MRHWIILAESLIDPAQKLIHETEDFMQDGDAWMDLTWQDDACLYIETFNSSRPGAGKELLQFLTKRADELKVTLVLKIMEDEEGRDPMKLFRYYQNFGFSGDPKESPDVIWMERPYTPAVIVSDAE